MASADVGWQQDVPDIHARAHDCSAQHLQTGKADDEVQTMRSRKQSSQTCGAGLQA